MARRQVKSAPPPGSSLQERMQAKLSEAGIAFKRIHVYGNQIMITAWSDDAAQRWADLLSKFSTINGVIRSLDENLDQPAGQWNREFHQVWRISATI